MERKERERALELEFDLPQIENGNSRLIFLKFGQNYKGN